ncbi:MAG: hypothetical protein ACLQM8_09310 [Limisphaerales bacterium]
MKRRVRHLTARNDDWTAVHRPPPGPRAGAGEGWWLGLLLKVGGGVLAFWVACSVIKAIVPFLVLGAIGWFGLKFFSK